MLYNLFFSTLPLFGLVLIGFTSGKFNLLNKSDSKVFLKLVGLVIVPALGIKIIGNFRYEFVNWYLYFYYLLTQSIIYFLGFSIAKLVFQRHFSEAIIIGMTSSFSNHLFFVYPIALFDFGPKDIVPIETIISVDFITVGLSICALELANHKKFNLGKILISQLKNPALIGLFLGLVIFYFQIKIHISIERLVNFVCDAGTPCALIAMGILLSYRTDKTQIRLSLVITLLKIIIFPSILFVILYSTNYDFNISRTTLMVAAAPIGAMGLVFASIYNVTTDAVVRSGVISYILALLSIPFFGTITPL